ncbi:uncharacterized protein LTR77_004336 [Saxophila tyrrhenica]|uniref:HMG box domain-containing protein n=1 Tax=Saxophila tyrrhenica TaxID=1690608 RepID=A0AAV9PFU9_9PEZI|nr:hypothetical protein LTR77_004336 [Saxophila tyrrhenica]
MSGYHDRPSWGGGEMAQPPGQKMVSVDVNEFIRTRDALASAYLNLSSSFERAVKAYLDHTQVVLNGDSTLNVGHMLAPFGGLGAYGNPAQVASAALQHNGGMAPEVKSEEPPEKKGRKKRTYKARDPNAPKRPLTAYFRFLQDVRGKIGEELQSDPDKYKEISTGNPGDISRIATTKWNQLSEDEKAPYKQAYQDELKGYSVLAEEYNKSKEDAEGEVDVPGVSAPDPKPQVTETTAAGAAEDDDDQSSDSDTDSESDEEEAAPAPPPKATTPPKKSSMKKNKTPATAAPPTFSSINAPAAAPASSPTRKRKTDASETEDSSKRGRKSKKTVTAGSDQVAPTAQMAAPAASSPEAVAEGGKKKKDRKKKSKSDA